jgi:rubrerythrin
MARAAREEGFEEIADWFETLAKAESLMPADSRKRSTRLTIRFHPQRTQGRRNESFGAPPLSDHQ